MYHHRSAMKIGTDAMILSAWADINSVNSVLDVGTGSGIIALMMAVRTNATIDAVELDKMSALESQDNFNRSPFSDRLSIFKNDYTAFAKNASIKYDLVISNPPFFINDMRPDNNQRKQARHTDSLTYEQLCLSTKQILDKAGKFCLVLPYSESKIFLEKASEIGFYLSKRLLIFPKPCKEPNRVNLELKHSSQKTILEEKFIIRDERGFFTQQYVDLLGNYYTNIKS